MDQVSAGEATRDGARTRRRRMREQARSRRAVPVPDRYQTPEWLERSFVLPLTHPEASDVPNQPLPSHDDDVARTSEPIVTRQETLSVAGEPTGTFTRPPSEEIDFGRMIRRADLCRKTGRLSWVSAALAGLALILFLLVASAVVLAVVVALALASLVSWVLRIRLARAPIPRLER